MEPQPKGAVEQMSAPGSPWKLMGWGTEKRLDFLHVEAFQFWKKERSTLNAGPLGASQLTLSLTLMWALLDLVWGWLPWQRGNSMSQSSAALQAGPACSVPPVLALSRLLEGCPRLNAHADSQSPQSGTC